jgi:hypothetical protein
VSHKKAATDPGKELHLYSRIGKYNQKRLSFFNQDMTDYDLSDIVFEIGVKRNPADDDFVTLTIGDGLTVTDNDLDFVFDEEVSATFTERAYYWELRRTRTGNTKVWLNGAHDWHRGKFNSFNNAGCTVNNDDVIIVIQESAAGVANAWIPVGDFDASGGSLPTVGGTGPADAFEAFNTLTVTVAGSIDGNFLPVGTILVAMQDNPTNDFSPTGWKYF